MCRESAVLIASVAARMGVPANICTGEFAVFGQMQDGRDGCLLFKTHAWVDIEGFGLCDFSPDFRPGAGPGWRNITARYLAGSKYFPHQTSEFGHYTRGRHEFDRLVADLTQATPHFRTVYLELERRPFDNFVFVGAVNYAQSPLMRELAASSTFDLNILAKAAIHLWLMVSGKRSSLRKMDQRAAWEAISAIDSRAAELFRQRLRYSA
jgi:hypothetical protein